jgi:lysophospholipase L1-like esterase
MHAPDRTPDREAQPAATSRLSLAARVVVIALSVLVTAAVCELLLRVYLIDHTVYDIEMVRYATLIKVESPNPLIGHEHRPNASAELMDVSVRTNSDGLRDVDHSEAHGDRYRIIFLGDSLTFGWGVNEAETFTSHLEAALNERSPTEIINFGTGNYNTEQEVNLFLEKGLKYHPDKVVVFYFINDAEPTPKKAPFAFLYESRLVTLAWSRLHALESHLGGRQNNYRTYYADLYQPEAPGWQRARAALLRLRDVCAERGIELQVVVLPELHELQAYPFKKEHEAVVSYLRGIGVPVLDLTPMFNNETDPMRLWVAPDDAHPNAVAHELIAKYALDFLSQRNR